MSKRIYRGHEAEGDWRRAVSDTIPREELRLRANARASAAYAEERERGYKEGFDAGYQEGWKSGAEIAAEEAQREHLARLAKLAEEISQLSERLEVGVREFWLRNQQQALELCVAIAETLLKQELQQRPEAILSVVRDALERVAGSQRIRIEVSVGDLPALKAAKEQLSDMLQGAKSVEISAADMRPGGCVIESDLGVVDASVETQMERLRSLIVSVTSETTRRTPSSETFEIKEAA